MHPRSLHGIRDSGDGFAHVWNRSIAFGNRFGGWRFQVAMLSASCLVQEGMWVGCFKFLRIGELVVCFGSGRPLQICLMPAR